MFYFYDPNHGLDASSDSFIGLTRVTLMCD